MKKGRRIQTTLSRNGEEGVKRRGGGEWGEVCWAFFHPLLSPAVWASAKFPLSVSLTHSSLRAGPSKRITQHLSLTGARSTPGSPVRARGAGGGRGPGPAAPPGLPTPAAGPASPSTPGPAPALPPPSWALIPACLCPWTVQTRANCSSLVCEVLGLLLHHPKLTRSSPAVLWVHAQGVQQSLEPSLLMPSAAKLGERVKNNDI